MSAFDQAFTLLKMPIDWDTVTEPTFSPRQRTGLNGEKISETDGEASAQWIHPKTGERYNLRMDKWIRNTLQPTDADLERNEHALPFVRESGGLSVTQPLSEERANALAEAMDTSREVLAEYGDDQEQVGGTDFFNNTDPFGRRSEKTTDDERSVPMPQLPRDMRGLGLGTDMYDLLNHWGVKLKPDENQNANSRRLWARNQGYSREIADQMATGMKPHTAPYHSLLREAVRRVRESGLHPSLDFDPTVPTGVVGYLKLWDGMGYDEGTEIMNWLNGAVASKNLPPFAETRPFLPGSDDDKDWADIYDRLRGGWTWRGHDERN
tara:strand:+ start:2359 stop:3327 length:969 start_codon:yes stop_codon:yes gene_type:complete